MDNTLNLDGKRVFLSYSNEDRQRVDLLAEKLKSTGAFVFSDDDIRAGESWSDAIRYQIKSSDYFIICLSKNSLKSQFLQFEYDTAFLNSAKDRHINIVPIQLDDTPIPDNLKEYQLVDLDVIVNTNFDRLLDKVVNLELVNFEDFTAVKFEELILELLPRLNFQRVDWKRQVSDRGFDFMAEYIARDPFGIQEKQTWIFECKLYKSARFDLKSVHSIIDAYKYIRRSDAKLALITNSQFTSVVKQHIDEIRNTEFIDIRLIDGFALKEIIAAHPDLIQRYFQR